MTEIIPSASIFADYHIPYLPQLKNGSNVHWQHILSFWEIESQANLRLCPRIREEHFSLPFGKKMRVDLCMQVISHSMAAALHALVDIGLLPPEARVTADFLQKMNDLFDSLNVRSTSDCYGFKAPTNRALLEERLSLWREAHEQISAWKFHARDSNKKVELPFHKGLLITLAAMQQLVPRLLDSGYAFVLTGLFNQDSIENLFAMIRRDRGGYDSHPEARKAIQTLRLVCGSFIVEMTQRSQNCESTGEQMLLEISECNSIMTYVIKKRFILHAIF